MMMTMTMVKNMNNIDGDGWWWQQPTSMDGSSCNDTDTMFHNDGSNVTINKYGDDDDEKI